MDQERTHPSNGYSGTGLRPLAVQGTSQTRNTFLYAIRWDAKDMVSLLLKEGIDFFFKDVFRWTALCYAIEGTSKR